MGLLDRLRAKTLEKKERNSFIRTITSGSFIRVSDVRHNESWSDIKNIIETMRSLATDSQVAIALSYYATDATTSNSMNQIIWATSEIEGLAETINQYFKKWNVNAYARSHILELAKFGNFYMPTTRMYAKDVSISQTNVVLDGNTIPDDNYDIIPSSCIDPADIIHLWKNGKPEGFVYKPDDTTSTLTIVPEDAVIHFSIGGLIGKYKIEGTDLDGEVQSYDIQFADPLMESTATPTRVLALLEDANVLASLSRTIKFINVDCTGDENEDAIRQSLLTVKSMIEQQMSVNTDIGDAQSYLNPQSPNNLIYLAKVNGQDAVSITDLNMADATDADNKLLNYFQDKKLSTLGVPKEAMNYSGAEGLGNAGSVMSQRSALYANILDRLETAYKAGWAAALNKFFIAHNMSGYVDKFELHMNPIITNQQTIMFDKRDSAMNQATTFIGLLRDLSVNSDDAVKKGITEILVDAFPAIAADTTNWNVDIEGGDNGGI
jgi:hypothetical protein